MPELKFNSVGYECYCADFSLVYFSPYRPTSGAWIRLPVEFVCVDSTQAGTGFVLTKEPIPDDKAKSLELEYKGNRHHGN